MAVHGSHDELAHPEGGKLDAGGTEVVESAARRVIEGAGRISISPEQAFNSSGRLRVIRATPSASISNSTGSRGGIEANVQANPVLVLDAGSVQDDPRDEHDDDEQHQPLAASRLPAGRRHPASTPQGRPSPSLIAAESSTASSADQSKSVASDRSRQCSAMCRTWRGVLRPTDMGGRSPRSKNPTASVS